MEITLKNGRRLYYNSINSGNIPVIWIHGFTCDGTDWREQIKYFKDGYHHILVDLNAHGQSPAQTEGLSMEGFADDIVLLAAALDMEEAFLVGHSMGCRVGLASLSHPDSRFNSAALIDCGLTATPETLEPMLAFAENLYNTGELEKFVETMFEGMFFNDTFDDLKKPIIERAKRLPSKLALQLALSVHKWDALSMPKTISSLNTPLLVIESNGQDEQGIRFPLKKNDSTPLLEMYKNAPNSEKFKIEVIPDSGHFVMLERPMIVNRLLASFFSDGAE